MRKRPMQQKQPSNVDGGSRIVALERDVYRVSRDIAEVQNSVKEMFGGFKSLAAQVGDLVALHKVEAAKHKTSPLTLLSIVVACIMIMGTVIALIEYDIKMISNNAVVPTTHTIDMLTERVRVLESAIKWTPHIVEDGKR